MENLEYMDDMLWGDSLKVGDTLPEFSFEVYADNEIKQMSTKDLKGKWSIFFFYPADFTFVCPTELEEMAEMYEDFKKEGAEVISVSTDTVFVHKAWQDASEAIKKIEYPMAADPNHMMSEMFGVLIKEEGVALRGTFVINPEGKLVLIEINDNSIGRSAKELMRKLRAAKFVAEHDGKVCPASWNVGDDVLEPGLDLVGKI